MNNEATHAGMQKVVTRETSFVDKKCHRSLDQHDRRHRMHRRELTLLLCTNSSPVLSLLPPFVLTNCPFAIQSVPTRLPLVDKNLVLWVSRPCTLINIGTSFVAYIPQHRRIHIHRPLGSRPSLSVIVSFSSLIDRGVLSTGKHRPNIHEVPISTCRRCFHGGVQVRSRYVSGTVMPCLGRVVQRVKDSLLTYNQAEA